MSAATGTALWLHLLVGPNGAGKSTLYRALARYPRTLILEAQPEHQPNKRHTEYGTDIIHA